MPRRKHDTYQPHRGTTRPRPVTKGRALNEDGTPCRLKNFHACGAIVCVGWKDFDTARWTAEFFAGRSAAAEKITRCPGCTAELSRVNVRALYPDQLDPQEEERKIRYRTPEAAAEAPE